MLPYEIDEICKELLSQSRDRLLRQPLGNDKTLPDPSVDDPTAESNSVLDYLYTVQQFVSRKADAVGAARKKLGLPECREENEKGGLRGAKGKAELFSQVLHGGAN